MRHLFYATTEDKMVYPISSSLPYLDGPDNEYRLCMGESHQTIVQGVFKDVVDWLKLS